MKGTILGVPYDKDYGIWGSILGSPYICDSMCLCVDSLICLCIPSITATLSVFTYHRDTIFRVTATNCTTKTMTTTD